MRFAARASTSRGDRLVNRLLAVLSLVALTTAVSLGWSAGRWAPLARDGLHDPANPSIDVLQEPSEALGILEPDPAGNKVDWVRSLQNGLIQPRPSLYDDREPQILDTTILMTETSDLPQVPHKPQTTKEPFVFEDTVQEGESLDYRVATVDSAGKKAVSDPPEEVPA